MKNISAILLMITALVLGAQAQQGQGTSSKVMAEIIATSSSQVVKGAPFSAEAVSESVQILSDGNKITRSYTTRMFRDSEGRFRREGGGGIGGAALGAGTTVYSYSYTIGGAQNTVTIFDPVSNQRYFLNPNDKTARRMPVIPGSGEGAVIVNGQPLSYAVKQRIETDAAKKAQVVVTPSLNETFSTRGKTESLGMRSFEGIEAEGTRTVTTLPAGTIGNEREIEIVYERWYSKDLQMIVYSRHSDPRFGEQIYRLANVNRSEQDRSLFTVPSDYKVVAEPTFNVVTTTTTTKP